MAALVTRVIRVDAEKPDDNLLMPAAKALRAGRLVAFPTETVYGLGANALNPAAVAAIFEVKGRPGDNPLIVHIASLADLPPLVRSIPPLAEKLFKAFSPGPLTLVLPKSAAVPDLVTAGLDTVAIRIPAHPVARRLIELAGVPVAAPSANRSGRPSPTRGWHVELDLDGRIPYLVEAGNCEFGIESTVVDVTGPVPVILRPGAITAAQIEAVVGAAIGHEAERAAGAAKAPRSPGMKYHHYAPRARVLIAEGDDMPARVCQAGALVTNLIKDGKRVGLFGCGNFVAGLPGPAVLLEPAARSSQGAAPPGPLVAIAYDGQPDAALASAGLFDALRRLDQARVAVIIAEALPDRGIGAAYMNRLRKAAGAEASDQADPAERKD
jgi:L-threonylcarbamoyladenylate synthase